MKAGTPCGPVPSNLKLKETFLTILLFWVFNWLRYQKPSKFDSKDNIFTILKGQYQIKQIHVNKIMFLHYVNSAKSNSKSEVTLTYAWRISESYTTQLRAWFAPADQPIIDLSSCSPDLRATRTRESSTTQQKAGTWLVNLLLLSGRKWQLVFYFAYKRG